jgi:RNA 3'-terminal phosphate cyclase (ATP)
MKNLYGIALASHLKERGVARRMAQSAQRILAAAGYPVTIELQDDATALQPGAALAVFANLVDGYRLGADCAGAPGRPSEVIGKRVASQLLSELQAGATLDRFAADQIIPFAALAAGESRFRVAEATEHIESNGWLAGAFLGAKVEVRDRVLAVRGKRLA